jgi:hypothetical protein
MADKKDDANWLPDSFCPVVPASGYYAIELLAKPKFGSPIFTPGQPSAVPGGIGIARIVAMPPPDDRIEAAGYMTSGLYGPGDVVWAHMSIDMKAEQIDARHPETGQNMGFYLISEGRILGRHRYPEAVLKSHEEQTNPPDDEEPTDGAGLRLLDRDGRRPQG